MEFTMILFHIYCIANALEQIPWAIDFVFDFVCNRFSSFYGTNINICSWNGAHTHIYNIYDMIFFLLNWSETKTIPHTQDRITRKIMQWNSKQYYAVQLSVSRMYK